MKNIEIFDRCVGLIFARLYEHFPMPLDFDLMDIPAELFDESDPTLTVARKMEIYEHTLRWLVSAGFVTAEHISDLKTSKARLSLKGLEILKKPSSFMSKKSIGEKLVEEIKGLPKSASLKEIKALVGKVLLKGALLLLWRYVSDA